MGANMKRKLHPFIARIAVGLSALAITASASAATLYLVEDLGNLPNGQGPDAHAINRYGQAVGASAVDSFPVAVGFNGTAHELPGVGGYSQAWSINRVGTVVGSWRPNAQTGPALGFVWKPDGTVTFLSSFAASGGLSDAHAVDDDGHVAGACSTVDLQQHACVWIENVPTDLGLPAGTVAANGYAVVGNPLRVAGIAWDPDLTERAFYWQAGQMYDLGTLRSDGTTGYSEAYGINRRGQVAGTASTDTSRHAFRWASDTGMVDLGTLVPKGYSFGLAINGAGTVVGEATVNRFDSFHAFIAHPGGNMKDLNEMMDPASGTGWVLMMAEGINDAGQIVGYGEHNGRAAAFRLTPMR